MRSPAAVLVFALAGCSGAAMDRGTVAEEIIGGTTDGADSAVVLLYITVPGQQGGSLCTGEVISPHVVLTAAHCAGGEDPTVTNAVWRVYLGADFSKATAADLLPVQAAHYHPQFDVNNLVGGNDVGVVILKSALPSTLAPLPFNHASMDSGFDGGTVRFVGYGIDNAFAQSGVGVKRTTTTTLTDHTPLLLHFSDGTHETCNGDSGGPAFMTIGGRETIVGVTSYGDINCDQGGYDTRIDAVAAWIDGYVAAADPGFNPSSNGGNTPPSNPSTPPSPSGGTQSPPTSSATPMPPSSTGVGGVGASCVSSNDCHDVHGGMGCSIVGGAAGGAGSATAAALMLIFNLAVQLGRVRRRARR